MNWLGAISRRINVRKFLNRLLLLLLMLTPTTSLAVDTAIAADEILLDVSINQQRKDTVLLLRSEGRLFAGAEDLRRWRVRSPETNPLNHYGDDFYALDALEGLTYRLDKSTQTLAVQVPPSLFDATEVMGKETVFSAPSLASPGGTLNYNVYASHSKGKTTTNGLLELRGFGSWGTAQTGILAKDLNDQASGIRLDTTWRRDQPM